MPKHKFLLMKNLLFIIVLFFSSQLIVAQSVIKGKVTDDKGAGVPYATILVYKAADTTMAKGEVTHSDGTFQVEGLKEGKYWMKISYVGYQDHKSDMINLNGESVFLPPIKLIASSVGLEGVEVKAQRSIIQMLPDKTVFNVDGSINATGHDALELLRKSPGVVVDNEDNITLSGKSGVKVFVNGKPTYLSNEDLAAYLKNMQSTEIDAIEIITNPSAKYEAEGNAGIINIRLKKDKSMGLNGSVNLGYSISKHAKYNASTSLNYRQGRVNLFGTYSFFTGAGSNYIDIYSLQNNLIIEKYNSGVWNPTNHSARVGMDYSINKFHTIGIMANGYYNTMENKGTSTNTFTRQNDKQLISILDANSNTTGSRENLNSNLNYVFNNGKNVTLNVDLDYGIFRNSRDNYQPNYYKDPQTGAILNEVVNTSYAPTDIDIYVGKIDHERPFLEGTLAVGGKSSFVTTNNTYDFYNVINSEEILDKDRSNNFVLDENINAVYTSYSRKINDFSINAGLRVEQTNSTGILTSYKDTEDDVAERHYTDFFPSGGVAWQASKVHQWRLNYSRRINRPDYQDLNPFEWKMTEISFMRGNPFLKPQYANVLSLSHSYKHFLNTTLSYTYTKDFFARITDSVDVNKSYLEPVNLDYQKVINLTVNAPFSPKKWWNTYTNLSVYNQHNFAESVNGRNVDVSVTTFSAYHQSSFMLPMDFSVQISGWYNSPSVWSGVMQTEANYSIDLGAQKRFLKGRATLKATFSDIFNTAPWVAVQEFPGYYASVNGGWESRQLRLNLSYNFGNQEVKKNRNRKTGLDQELERVKEQE